MTDRTISMTVVLTLGITGPASRAEIAEAVTSELPLVDLISTPERHVKIAAAREAGAR